MRRGKPATHQGSRVVLLPQGRTFKGQCRSAADPVASLTESVEMALLAWEMSCAMLLSAVLSHVVGECDSPGRLSRLRARLMLPSPPCPVEKLDTY